MSSGANRCEPWVTGANAVREATTNNTNGRARARRCTVCTARALEPAATAAMNDPLLPQRKPRPISATTPSCKNNDMSTGRAGVSATIRRGEKGFTFTAGFKSLPFLAGGCQLQLGGYCKYNKRNVRLRGISGTHKCWWPVNFRFNSFFLSHERDTPIFV